MRRLGTKYHTVYKTTLPNTHTTRPTRQPQMPGRTDSPPPTAQRASSQRFAFGIRKHEPSSDRSPIQPVALESLWEREKEPFRRLAHMGSASGCGAWPRDGPLTSAGSIRNKGKRVRVELSVACVAHRKEIGRKVEIETARPSLTPDIPNPLLPSVEGARAMLQLTDVTKGKNGRAVGRGIAAQF